MRLPGRRSSCLLGETAALRQAVDLRRARVREGNALTIVDIGAECVGSNQEVLPMLHTHADGNCQFSPVDLVTVVAAIVIAASF